MKNTSNTPIRFDVVSINNNSIITKEVAALDDRGSAALHLRFRGEELSGRYTPVPGSSLAESGPPVSFLKGAVSNRADGVVVLRGTWKHADNSEMDSTGGFEMCETEGEEYDGHWWNMGEVGVKHSWKWSAAAASSSRSTCWQRLSDLVNSKWMSRYSMFLAWLFALMTAASLGLATVGDEVVQSSTKSKLNLLFNVIFTLSYASFHLSYRAAIVKPARLYEAGVGFYTLGYGLFVVLFVAALAPDLTSAGGGQWIYVSGSVSFLLGSILLLVATIPRSKPWCGISGSVFWGVVMFLVGSILFTLDSTWGLVETPPASLFCTIAGNAVFLCGRFFFVHGSTTDACNPLFRSTKREEEEEETITTDLSLEL